MTQMPSPVKDLSAESLEEGVDFDPFGGVELERVVPTTESQQEIWLADQLGREASLAYNQVISIRLSGNLHVPGVSAALAELVERHEALRASVSDDGNDLMIARSVEVPLLVQDLLGLDEVARQEAIAGELRRAVEQRFDLANGPLLRAHLLALAESEHLLVLAAHHIICDGWSLSVIVEELGTLYARACNAASHPLPPADRFSDYAAGEANRAGAQAFAADEAYWLGQFRGSIPSLQLPEDFKRPASRTFASLREDSLLDGALAAELKRFAGKIGISLFSLLTAGFAALLAKVADQDEIVIGVPSAGQPAAGMTSLVGHCVNLLPIRIPVDRTMATPEFLRTSSEALLDALDHQRYTFGTLLKKLHLPRDPSRVPLVGVMFNLGRPISLEYFGVPDLKADIQTVPRTFEAFELFVNVSPTSEGLRLECQYNIDLFDAETVNGWLRGYERILRGIVAAADLPVGQLPVVDEVDYRRILTWNDTRTEHDRSTLIHDLLEAQMRRVPERVALECGAEQMTYGELRARSDRLAQALRARGHGRGDLVGLCIDRGLDMVVSQLAVLKAGAAYVPMDPSYPQDRLAYMAEDAQLAGLITRSDLQSLVPWPRESSLLIDEDRDWIAQFPDHGPQPGPLSARPEDAAYVIYTSGSTGRPKGVVVPHGSVVNFLRSMANEPGLKESDRLVAVTTLSFDIAVLELLLPLSVGARVIVADRDTAADGQALARVLQTSGATVMQGTPSTWQMLIEAGWNGSPSFKALVGGEALRQDLAAQLASRTAELWNMYGPTETTVWSTCCRVGARQGRGISIGKPIANTTVWILDEHGQVCPVGTAGEIYIGGQGVTQGYLRRPELTEARYFRDILSPGSSDARLYRTGDRGRWCSDGMLEHLGRLDFQVKVRGYRIELGEIESNLAAHDRVARCVVTTREDEPGNVKIVAYAVYRGESPVDPQILRAHLGLALPEYMIPQHFVQIEEIPLLPNGKVDRARLPRPRPPPGRSARSFRRQPRLRF
jgi:amino acid adenylation domain-containing protein